MFTGKSPREGNYGVGHRAYHARAVLEAVYLPQVLAYVRHAAAQAVEAQYVLVEARVERPPPLLHYLWLECPVTVTGRQHLDGAALALERLAKLAVAPVGKARGAGFVEVVLELAIHSGVDDVLEHARQSAVRAQQSPASIHRGLDLLLQKDGFWGVSTLGGRR